MNNQGNKTQSGLQMQHPSGSNLQDLAGAAGQQPGQNTNMSR